MVDDITNYVNGNSPFGFGDTPQMKVDHDKCHLLTSTLTSISIKVKDSVIKNSDNEKLLGVTIDANLNFIVPYT